MRKNSAQTGQIVDFIYAKTDSTATGNLVNGPSAHNISDTEVQIVDAKSPTLAYDHTADAIQIVQGTPNSTSLYDVDPFGTGYPDVEKSGILKKGNVLSVSKYEYALPTYQVVQLDTLAGFDDNTTYQMVVTMQSTRGDITYGMNKEVFSVSYDKSLATPTHSTMLSHLVTELNKFSKVVGNVTGTGGTKPFIVLAIDTTTTQSETIGKLDTTDSIPVGTYNGIAVTYKVDKNLLHTLNQAIDADSTLYPTPFTDGSTTGYKVVDGTTATLSSAARLLFVSLDETPVLAFDDIMEVKTKVDFGINDLTYTKTELVEPFEGTGLGTQVLLWYRSKAKLQKFNMQNHPIHGEFFINQDLPEYFTEDGKYSLTIIDYIDTVDTINGTSTHPKQVVIVHDATETVGADVAAGVTVATTATATFENDLTAWIAASNSVKTIDFLGTATVSNVTFG
jgi:hypothetical protein